jgi:predicted nucleic acid-binding protein
MKLEDLPDGTRIFVDANILIYHFSGASLECQAFLQRCESRQLEAFTGVHIVLEVVHRLMMLEALQKGLITGGQPARKLREQPEIVKVLQAYNESVQQIPHLNIHIRAITSEVVGPAKPSVFRKG